MAGKTYHLPEGSHSVLGPSGAHRWFECPGSIQLHEFLGKGSGQDVSQVAAEGTAAHHVFAECLRDNRDAYEFFGDVLVVGELEITVDQEMVVYLQTALREVRNRIDQHCMIYVEENVKYANDARATGSADVGIYNVGTRTLEVIDLKTGAGLMVEAEGNEQLLCYAAGFRRKIEGTGTKKAEIDTFLMTIIQPRGTGPIAKTAAPVTRDMFLKWEKETLAKAIRAVRSKKPKFKAGDHCRFCAGQTACATFKSYVAPAVSVDNAAPLEEASIEELVAIYERTPMIRKYLYAVEARIKFMLQQGLASEENGVKLVKARANRKWRDDEGVERAAISQFGEDKVYTHTFISPAQMDKLPGGKDFSKANAFTPEAGLKVALAGDKAPAVKPDGAAAFDGVTKQ